MTYKTTATKILSNRIPVWFFSVWTDSPNFLMFFLPKGRVFFVAFGRVLRIFRIFRNLAIKLIPDLMDISGRSSWIPLSVFLKPNCFFSGPWSEKSERRAVFLSEFFGFQRGKEINLKQPYPPWNEQFAPENRPSWKETSIPSIHFQGRCSFRGG